jgi:D-glycero-D-manno-heptose 1,7-bisphosphate phosphatase
MGVSDLVKQRAIFLDRDGVLNAAIVKNGKPYPPQTIDELIIPPDVPVALSLLRESGFLLIGATNQPDVARGTTQKTLVEMMNSQLMAKLPLDEIRVCFHDDSDGCACRKPLPGMLMAAAEEHQIDLKASFMIGDRWKDIEAGKQAKCKTIWLKNDYDEKSAEHVADYVAASLIDAAEWIIKKS